MSIDLFADNLLHLPPGHKCSCLSSKHPQTLPEPSKSHLIRVSGSKSKILLSTKVQMQVSFLSVTSWAEFLSCNSCWSIGLWSKKSLVFLLAAQLENGSVIFPLTYSWNPGMPGWDSGLSVQAVLFQLRSVTQGMAVGKLILITILK